MGQYHYTVNLTKREFLNPHKLGDGLKLVEQAGYYSPGGINDALHLLLAVSNGRGGGDFQVHPLVGRWGGDRIAVVGDYAEAADLPAEDHAERIYGLCMDAVDAEEACAPPTDERYRDITEEVIPVLEQAYEIVYFGDGWCQRAGLDDLVEGFESTCGGAFGPDGSYEDPAGGRIASVAGRWYAVNDLIAAIKRTRPREPRPKLTVEQLKVKPLKPAKRKI